MSQYLRCLSAFVVAICVVLITPDICCAVAVNVTAPTGPFVVAKGETVQFTFSAADSSPPSPSSLPGEPPTPCPISGPNWSWSASSGSGSTVSVAPPGNTASVTVNASFSNVGTYTLAASATASYTDSPCTHNYSGMNSGSVEVHVVEIEKLQYQLPSETWVDAPSTMYVLAGHSVKFRAVASPTSVFPSGKPAWSGSSGANGSTDTTTVSFSSASSTSIDFKTVICTCGNIKTIDVLVYDLTPTAVPVENFAGRDLDWGTCEFIQLGYQTTPSGVTDYQIGGLTWQNPSNAGWLQATGATGTYQCPDVEASVALNVVINSGPMVGETKAPPVRYVYMLIGHDIEKHPDTGLWHVNNKVGVKVRSDYWSKIYKKIPYREIEVREGLSTMSVATVA